MYCYIVLGKLPFLAWEVDVYIYRKETKWVKIRRISFVIASLLTCVSPTCLVSQVRRWSHLGGRCQKPLSPSVSLDEITYAGGKS